LPIFSSKPLKIAQNPIFERFWAILTILNNFKLIWTIFTQILLKNGVTILAETQES
jgi:hypothetical protein